MSIAANFERKWSAIVSAVDATRGESESSRFAAAAKAAYDAELVLIEKAAIAALAKRIQTLEAERDSNHV